MRHARAVLAAVLTAALGCGVQDSTPTDPGPVRPVVELVSLQVSGDSVVVEENTASFVALGRYSDGSTTSSPPGVKWSSSDTSVATINALGMVTALRPGNFQVVASLGPTRGTASVRVKNSGTPWSELPPISEAGKKFLQLANLGYTGRVKRWEIPTLSVWADPSYSREYLRIGFEYWAVRTNGNLAFRLVTDSASADVIIVFDATIVDPPSVSICGTGGPTKYLGDVMVRGEIRLKPVGCLGIGVLIHEIGHVIGIMGHTPPNQDVMGFPQLTLNESPVPSEVAGWMYHGSVRAGTKPY